MFEEFFDNIIKCRSSSMNNNAQNSIKCIMFCALPHTLDQDQRFLVVAQLRVRRTLPCHGDRAGLCGMFSGIWAFCPLDPKSICPSDSTKSLGDKIALIENIKNIMLMLNSWINVQIPENPNSAFVNLIVFFLILRHVSKVSTSQPF